MSNQNRKGAAWRGFPVVFAFLLLLPLAACTGASGNADGEGVRPGPEAEATPRTEMEQRRPSAETMTVPVGTEIRASLDQKLGTQENQEGDTFTATVADTILSQDVVAIPVGSTIRGRVTAVKKADNATEKAVLKVDFTEIEVRGESRTLQAELVEANPKSVSRTSEGEAAATIGGGAAAGAVLGTILGDDTEATIAGAAVGAAAGSAIVLGTGDVDAVLPEGSTVRIRLQEAVRVQAPE